MPRLRTLVAAGALALGACSRDPYAQYSPRIAELVRLTDETRKGPMPNGQPYPTVTPCCGALSPYLTGRTSYGFVPGLGYPGSGYGGFGGFHGGFHGGHR